MITFSCFLLRMSIKKSISGDMLTLFVFGVGLAVVLLYDAQLFIFHEN